MKTPANTVAGFKRWAVAVSSAGAEVKLQIKRSQ